MQIKKIKCDNAVNISYWLFPTFFENATLKGHYSIFMCNNHAFIYSFNLGVSIMIRHVPNAEATSERQMHALRFID